VFLILVFLHVVSVIAAITVSYGPLVMLQIAFRRGDTQTLRAMTSGARVVTISTPFFYVVGAIFGVLAALNGGINLFAAWLLISYVLFIVLMVLGAAILGPWAERLGSAAASAPDGPFSTELLAVVRDPRIRLVRGIDGVVLVLLLFVMVVKPFS
jgi:uncharacterized membrane protein